MNRFYQFPFVYLTPILILGIIIGVNSTWTAVICVLLFLWISLWTLKLLRILNTDDWKGSLLLSAILFLGIISSNTGESANNLNVFPGDSVSFVARVVEMSDQDGVWKKGIAQVSQIIDSAEASPTHFKLLFYSRERISEGNLIIARSQIMPIRNKMNPGEFDAETYWFSKGISNMSFLSSSSYFILEESAPNIFRSFFNYLRSSFSSLIDNYVPINVNGVAKAILLGDKSSLSIETRNSFANAGAMHVLAVSGLHVGIIMYLLIFIFQRFSRVLNRNQALFIVLIITWLYAGVTGFSPSVVRATMMFTILLASQFLSRQNNSINALFFSAFILIIIDPMVIRDIGFQLSYLAMLGILLFYRPISKLILLQNNFLRKIWEGTCVGIAAQLLTVPLSLYYFHQFPNYFMISNLVVMLLAGVILAFGLFFFAFGFMSIIGKYMGLLLGVVLMSLLYFMQFVESIPGSVAEGFSISFAMLILMYTLLILSILVEYIRKKIVVVSILAMTIYGFIQFDRYHNLSSNELVIFNSNTPLISVKKGESILCFHKDDPKSLERAKRIMTDYLKVKPGEVKYFKLARGIVNISDEIILDNTAKGINLKYDRKSIVIHRSYESQLEKDKLNLFLPYLESDELGYSLGEGAIIIEL